MSFVFLVGDRICLVNHRNDSVERKFDDARY